MGSDGRPHRGGRSHDDTARRDARPRQRLPAPGRPGQGGGHPRRGDGRPLRVRHWRRLVDDRLRAVGHPDGASVGTRGAARREPRDHAHHVAHRKRHVLRRALPRGGRARVTGTRDTRGPPARHRRRQPPHPDAGRSVRPDREHRAEPGGRLHRSRGGRRVGGRQIRRPGAVGQGGGRASGPTISSSSAGRRRCRSSRTQQRWSRRWPPSST